MYRLLIVDDSSVYLKTLDKILSPYFEIVGLCKSGLVGVDMYSKLKPDLVLMDITMPNYSGKECLQRIIEIDSQARVIMVSSVGDDETVQECLQVGAKAFVNKEKVSYHDGPSSLIVMTILEVLGNHNFEKIAG